MKASDLFVKCLENEGVEYIFGIPGEENLDVLESLKDSKIKLIITRHEQAAGFMAATVGRLTGKAAAAIATLGPGATNFTTSSAYAHLGGMPMFMVTGQKPIKKSKQGKFQIVDIVSMMKPLTKFTKQVREANSIPTLIRESFKLAHCERLGPTHLELPEDIAREDADTNPLEVTVERMDAADESSMADAIKMITEAKNPLLLIGAACNHSDLPAVIQKFAAKTGMYFFNSQMGKGVIDERDEHFLGTCSLSGNDRVHCASSKADLVISVGHDIIEKPPFIMTEDGAKVIHINYSAADVDRVYFPHLNLVGDIEKTMSALTEAIEPQEHWDFDYFKTVKEDVDKTLAEGAESDVFPMIPQRIVADMRKIMPDDGILALDNGMYKLWFARHYPAYLPRTILLDNALASMGAGLPSAIAAKIVYPDKKVVAICGDGGFMMNSQELETAVRLGLDLVVMILNDNGYGMIKWKQEDMGFDNFGLEFGNPDFIKYAESYGVTGHRIESAAALTETLETAFAAGGVHLIEVPIDYSENIKLSAETLKQDSCPA